ncbi:MAG TPA: YigZ family protein [Saprospiraceae bacterium]|nr:YigZ family protein [Saprospiraceae bacterium]
MSKLADDIYFTLQETSEGVYRDRGSKFIAIALPFTSESHWQGIIDFYRKTHPKSAHVCAAYRLGPGKNIFRFNDDGEPSGTAGRPILSAIDSAGVSDVMVVVVRYFGGTLLGTSGLIKAYKEAATLALAHAIIVEKFLTSSVKITFEYSHMGVVMDALKTIEADIIKKSWNEKPFIIVQVRKSEQATFRRHYHAILLGRKLDEIDEDTSLDYCDIEFINS